MLQTTDLLRVAAEKTAITPNLVLEIDGWGQTYSLAPILTQIQIGDPGLEIGDDWEIGGAREETSNSAYIDLSGSTTSIGQQLNQDKGGASSVSSIQISLLDPDSEITRLVSPGYDLSEILGRKAWVYIGLADGGLQYPRDYPILFSGIIDDIAMDSKITITVSHPEQKKRKEIFNVVEVNLAQNLSIGGTTIYLDSVDNLFSEVSGTLLTYVKINDEIIRYAAIDSGTNSLTGCTRAQFGTFAASHQANDTVSSFYRLMGDAISLSLKLMLSSDEPYFVESLNVDSFDGALDSDPNSAFFSEVDLVTKYGISIGDYMTTTGATNGANNAALSVISAIAVDESGTTVTVTGPTYVSELASGALAAFKSQYNVLPDGLGLGADEVDIEEFLRIDNIYNAQFHDYDFYLTDTVEGKEFIDQEILYPSNLYSIPRRGKVSVGVVSPPLAQSTLAVLDADSILNPNKIKVRRNINKYLYNQVVVRYDFDAVETDTPLAGYISRDEDSVNRFSKTKKTYKITARGLRRSSGTDSILDITSRRLLDRYSGAAEFIQCEVAYRVGFMIDVGDVVLFGDEDMPISDSVNGRRGFSPRLCEVVDRKLDIKAARCSLTLVDTSYLLTGRYGIVSPSSVVGASATASLIPIVSSYGYEKEEWEKWSDFVGEDITVHSTDWVSSYDTKIIGVNEDNTLSVETLPVSPTAGWVIDIQSYPNNTNPNDNFKLKNVFVFFNPKLDIVTGVSGTEFTLSVSDAAKVTVGATVLVHNADYSVSSPEVRVSEINGTTIIVDTDLGFTPTSAYDVDLVGFVDGGSPYRYI